MTEVLTYWPELVGVLTTVVLGIWLTVYALETRADR